MLKKYELKLELYQTFEAIDLPAAMKMADYEVSRLTGNELAGDLGYADLTGNGLAGDLGYTDAVWTVKAVKKDDNE